MNPSSHPAEGRDISAAPVNASPNLIQKTSLVQVGGALGIAACCIGLAVFLMGCFGFGAALGLSILPVLLGAVGLVLAIIGAIREKPSGPRGTQPIAALFVTIVGLLGGLLELAVWVGWQPFR